MKSEAKAAVPIVTTFVLFREGSVVAVEVVVLSFVMEGSEGKALLPLVVTEVLFTEGSEVPVNVVTVAS